MNGLSGYLKDLQEFKKNQANPVILSNKYQLQGEWSYVE